MLKALNSVAETQEEIAKLSRMDKHFVSAVKEAVTRVSASEYAHFVQAFCPSYAQISLFVLNFFYPSF